LPLRRVVYLRAWRTQTIAITSAWEMSVVSSHRAPGSAEAGFEQGATATTGDSDIAWVNEVLWGIPVDVAIGAADRGHRAVRLAEFVAVPSASRPHLLVPLDSRRAAERALKTYTDARRTVRVGAPLLALAARAGILPALGQRVRVFAREDAAHTGELGSSLHAYLRDVLGTQDIQIAIRMGRRRPNRKPVLQVLTSAGGVLAYVKVGGNDLTRELVRNEASVLRTLRETGEPKRSFAFPTVLHAGRCGDLDVLVLEPVSPGPWMRSVASRDELVAIARDIARLAPETRETFAASDYWLATRARLDALAERVRTSRFDVLQDLLARLEDRYGDIEVRFGGWHGDWTRWNMARPNGQIVVFDWERSGKLAPIGLDAAHFDFDMRVKFKRRSQLAAIRSLLHGGGTVLPAFASASTPARLVVSLDLLEMTLRYEEARLGGLDIPDTLYFGAFRSAVLSS
jgi:hypothetical protein